MQTQKTPVVAGVSVFTRCGMAGLLDFAFLVDHVLANNRVILLDFELVRHSTLVLIRRIKVAGTRR